MCIRDRKKGIEFEADMEDAREVRLDAGLMELVWTNLLSNAFKFTEAGGTVTLSERTTEEGVAVCVSDTGCGMDEATCARVFEKFYQGDTSHATEGNGLGLAPVSYTHLAKGRPWFNRLATKLQSISNDRPVYWGRKAKGGRFDAKVRLADDPDDSGHRCLL